MDSVSVLIGGKAGFGIDKSGFIIGRLLNRLNYRIYIYRDYPSLIRGGHTFSIIRAANERILTHRNKVDFILALNQDTLDLHKDRLKNNSVVIYDSDSVKAEGLPSAGKTIAVALGKIMKEENAQEIMRNTCIIGAFCKAAGMGWDTLEGILRKEISKEIDINLKVCRRGFDAAQEIAKVEPLTQKALPLLSGSVAAGLGLINAGLKSYLAYPMTPSSPLLHFLADVASEFALKVIHPESEIGVILMGLGFSYMGQRAAVGTSGGGFCLMTETLSLSGMAELPIVIVVGQRPGPSTGLPTYTAQTDLHFVLNAGQGEFVRFVVAPGDAEEAYYWSGFAMNMSWKYQIPAIILLDKTLAEGIYNFDATLIKEIKEETPLLWDRQSPYKRYLNAEKGVSPLAFVPEKDTVIKANSYEHDESGITTEDPKATKMMQDKRLRKEKYLAQDLEQYEGVKVYNDKNPSGALLCWGSNKGPCLEVAQNLGLKVIQPLVLSPFPVKQFKEALIGVKRLICVENNATGQLSRLLKVHGFNTDDKILKYDGRPFSADELEQAVKEVLR